MPTNKQQREAARRHLERQLERRRERELARRRNTLIASIVGTVVIVGLIVGFVIANTGGGKKSAAKSTNTASPSPTTSASPTPTATPSTSYPPAKGASVTFNGVTVKGAADLAGRPTVTSKSTKNATTLEYKDLVVGKGAAAKASSTVTVQYVGVLYKDGKMFDSSWERGQPASFALSGVIAGFKNGIAGTTKIPAMKVGGRRILIIPANEGYGSQSNSSIPANSSLVFVVDLKKLS